MSCAKDKLFSFYQVQHPWATSYLTQTLILLCLCIFWSNWWTLTETARIYVWITITYKWSHLCCTALWCRSKTMNSPNCIFFWLVRINLCLSHCLSNSHCLHPLYLPFLGEPHGRFRMEQMTDLRPRRNLKTEFLLSCLVKNWFRIWTKTVAVPLIPYGV